jgi:hypothetical protein
LVSGFAEFGFGGFGFGFAGGGEEGERHQENEGKEVTMLHGGDDALGFLSIQAVTSVKKRDDFVQTWLDYPDLAVKTAPPSCPKRPRH